MILGEGHELEGDRRLRKERWLSRRFGSAFSARQRKSEEHNIKRY